MATVCEWTRPEDEPCCCEQECCLYPADAIFLGEYEFTDLPATLSDSGVVAAWVKQVLPTLVSIDGISAFLAYAHSENASLFLAYTENDGWVITVESGGSYFYVDTVGNCISADARAQDEFPDTLLLDIVINGFTETNVPLERDLFDKCTWVNAEFGPSPGYAAFVVYDASLYKWTLRINIDPPYFHEKAGDQDTPLAPLGSYPNEGILEDIVIHD